MRLWFGLVMIGCAEKAMAPCMEGTVRDAQDRCVPEDAPYETEEESENIVLDSGEPTDNDTGSPEPGPAGGDGSDNDTNDDTNDDTDDGVADADDEDTDPPYEPDPTPPWMSLADATITLWGGAVGARVGRAAASAGDIDGDGRADILIGADRANGVEGVTYGGWATLHYAASLPDSGRVAVEGFDSRWIGFSEGELVGHNLTGAGDLNGDGRNDLLIAGYHAPAGGRMRGSVYGISGTSIADGTFSTAEADWTINGSRNVEGMGHGMSRAGDMDADGLDDIVLGGCCGETSPRVGRAWVITGAALTASDGVINLDSHTPRWDGEANNDQAGYKTSPLGDIDGDGLDDVAIAASQQGGAATKGGKVYILYGSSIPGVEIGALADADVHLPGTAPGGEHGYDVGRCGDMDGDGLNEIVVGAHKSSRNAMVAGEAMLYFGSSLTAAREVLDTAAAMRFITYEANHFLGISVEGGMDFDGNGSLDLILGASGMAPPTVGDPGDADGMDSPGDAYLYWGEDLVPGVHDVEDASVHFEGEDLLDHAGIRVTSAGDTNEDGADDLLIGTERGQYGVGQAYLLTGLRAPPP